MKRPLVFIASPLTRAAADADTAYAAAATRDSLLRGESPVCPHVLYPAVLDDTPEHRKLGMVAGAALVRQCDIFALYVDRGIGRGMRVLLDRARGFGVTVDRRRIEDPPEPSTDGEPETPTPRRNFVDLG